MDPHPFSHLLHHPDNELSSKEQDCNFKPGQVAGVGHDAVVGDVVPRHHPHGRATVEAHPEQIIFQFHPRYEEEPNGQLCIGPVRDLEDDGAYNEFKG